MRLEALKHLYDMRQACGLLADFTAGKTFDDYSAEAMLRSAVERDLIRVLVKAGSGDLVVREIDSDDPQLAAIEISGGGMTPVSLYVNRDNGLVEKTRYIAVAEVRSEELYSDYRDVKGVQFAFHTVLRRGSLPEIERDVRTILYNVPLPPGLFVKPS